MVVGGCRWLHSTKWNANLILLRDYGELVALCKAIGWEIYIPNIPEGRKNGHPHNFCRGMSRQSY